MVLTALQPEWRHTMTNYSGTFPLNAYSAYTGLLQARPKVKKTSTSKYGVRRMGIIGTYAIINRETGQAYVGSSEDVIFRWSVHSSRLRNGNHANDILQDAYDEMPDDWFFTILNTYETTDGLLDKEVEDASIVCDTANLLQYKLGNGWINGWSPKTSRGSKVGYSPRARYGRHGVSRWFDGVSQRGAV